MDAFAYYDAARTDGYVSSKQHPKQGQVGAVAMRRTDLGTVIPSNGGGLFDEDKDEDCDQTVSSPSQQNTRQHNATPPSRQEIRLNRLLDDYMLSEHGDTIIKQMEELTESNPIFPDDEDEKISRQSPVSLNVYAILMRALTIQVTTGACGGSDSHPSFDLDKFNSVDDFEKYISEN
ncbi:TPA: hypothetical protein N0F65_001791 [Lagenidium giganteum]|uniref:Uncharacterized protein n=1 Tax=Lagenidium giganteum TaxID=4803 RepID=A0AAV2Z1S4_9STRA|nr:TPA: hypothetical protein N0F65_001791 [Lagenidium giganteum]